MVKMNSPMRITMIVVIVIAAVVVSGLGSFFGGGIYLAYRGQHLRTRLLCESDHQAILEACRQLSRDAMSGKLEPRSYRVRRRPDPEVAKFPEPIRALRPDHVAIDRIDGHVRIEMSGGWDSLGVYAYPDDFKERFPFEYHDRKIIDGLWYYDEFYKSDRDGTWDKKVETLLKGSEKRAESGEEYGA